MTKACKTGRILRAVACGFILSMLVSLTGFSAECVKAEQNVVRLHVRANSDSEADQNIKLAVRDSILREAEKLFFESDDFDSAVGVICTHMESLEAAANRVLVTHITGQTASVTIHDEYFPTRSYDFGKLPAGKYRTLRVDIGEAEGKNWWCVIYPTVCLSGSSHVEEFDCVSDENGLIIKLRCVELFNELLEFFDAGHDM